MCKGDEWQELIQAQSTAAFGTLSAGSTVVCNAARKKLNKTWREVKLNTFVIKLCNGGSRRCLLSSLASPF